MNWFCEQLKEQVGYLMAAHCRGRSLRERYDNHFASLISLTTLKALMAGKKVRPDYLGAFAIGLPLTRPERAELRIVWGERLTEAKTYTAIDRDKFSFDNRAFTAGDEAREASYGIRKGSRFSELLSVCRRRGGGLVHKSPHVDLQDLFEKSLAGRSMEAVARLSGVPAPTLRSFRSTGRIRPAKLNLLCSVLGIGEFEAQHLRGLYVQSMLGADILDVTPSDLLKRFKIEQYPCLFEWLIAGTSTF